MPGLRSVLKKLNLGRLGIVITNPVINKLHGARLKEAVKDTDIQLNFLEVPDSEKSKSAEVCIKLLEDIAELDRGRGIFIIAFGGGVIGDLSGFAASIYKRGVPYIQIPTTLLAQVDSAIGGKTAVDLPCGKNLAGSFYQPRLVISELSWLSSLPMPQRRQALAEIIKYAVIADAGFFCFLEKNYPQILELEAKKTAYVIKFCSMVKARVVEKDELDKEGRRVILNFGHTTGHALETASGYACSFSHGEAVALGMLAACEIARELKMISRETLERIETLINKAGLPVKIKGLSLEDILNAQSHDKKFGAGKNLFVLPERIGKVTIKRNIPQHIVNKAIASRIEK